MQAKTTAPVADRDVDLVARLILKADSLAPGEAFDIGGADGIIVGRSPSGRLLVGSGGINCGWTRWWLKGDPHENLRESVIAPLDRTKTGYFAREFRQACERALERPASKVTGVGRRNVRRVP